MADLIVSLKEWADWVVVDSPPLLAVADASACARWADGILMVTRGGSSTRDAAKKGREMLDKVGARVVGVAVWGLEEAGSRGGYGYYYDGYYGGYYYSDYYNKDLIGGAMVGRRSGKPGKPDSGAKGFLEPAVASEATDIRIYEPVVSRGRRAAEFIGRVMAGVLAFVVVVAVIAVVVYFLDQAFGWGILAMLGALR